MKGRCFAISVPWSLNIEIPQPSANTRHSLLLSFRNCPSVCIQLYLQKIYITYPLRHRPMASNFWTHIAVAKRLTCFFWRKKLASGDAIRYFSVVISNVYLFYMPTTMKVYIYRYTVFWVCPFAYIRHIKAAYDLNQWSILLLTWNFLHVTEIICLKWYWHIRFINISFPDKCTIELGDKQTVL